MTITSLGLDTLTEVCKYLKISDINTLRQVKKCFNEIIDDNDNFWKIIAKNQKISIDAFNGKEISYSKLQSLIAGYITIETNSFYSTGSSFLVGSTNCPCISVALYNYKRRKIVSEQKRREKIAFGILYKQEYYTEKETKERLSEFTHVYDPIPSAIPVRYLTTKKDGDIIYIKIRDQLYKLKCSFDDNDIQREQSYSYADFADNQNNFCQVLSFVIENTMRNPTPWGVKTSNASNIDSFQGNYIDLDGDQRFQNLLIKEDRIRMI